MLIDRLRTRNGGRGNERVAVVRTHRDLKALGQSQNPCADGLGCAWFMPREIVVVDCEEARYRDAPLSQKGKFGVKLTQFLPHPSNAGKRAATSPFSSKFDKKSRLRLTDEENEHHRHPN